MGGVCGAAFAERGDALGLLGLALHLALASQQGRRGERNSERISVHTDISQPNPVSRLPHGGAGRYLVRLEQCRSFARLALGLGGGATFGLQGGLQREGKRKEEQM